MLSGDVGSLLHHWIVFARDDQLPSEIVHALHTAETAMVAASEAFLRAVSEGTMAMGEAPLGALPGADSVPEVTVEDADWRTWLIMGGRGSGKTRTGAEWVRAQALGLPPFAHRAAGRIALVGETIADVRSVMVEGVSGILSVHAPHERPVYEPSKRQLTWANGRRRAAVLGRGPGRPARPAVRGRLVR